MQLESLKLVKWLSAMNPNRMFPHRHIHFEVVKNCKSLHRLMCTCVLCQTFSKLVLSLRAPLRMVVMCVGSAILDTISLHNNTKITIKACTQNYYNLVFLFMIFFRNDGQWNITKYIDAYLKNHKDLSANKRKTPYKLWNRNRNLNKTPTEANESTNAIITAKRRKKQPNNERITQKSYSSII